MDYPNLMNVQNVHEALEDHPGFKGINKVIQGLHFDPPSAFSNLPARLSVFLEDLLGDFIKPSPGHVHFFYRTERLRYLDDAVFSVQLPKRTFSHGRFDAISYDAEVVSVEHKRSHHEVAEFDSARYYDDNQENYLIEYDEDNPGSKIQKFVNVSLLSRNLCSTYSDFFLAFQLPSDWHEVHIAMQSLHDSCLNDYFKSRQEKINGLIREGKSPKSIRKQIIPDDAAIIDKHEELLSKYTVNNYIVRTKASQAINRVMDEYVSLIQVRPYVRIYNEATSFMIDDKERILSMHNIANEREIRSSDISNSLAIIEVPPFNDHFHNVLSEQLQNVPAKKAPYINNAVNNLRAAYELAFNGFFPAAISAASTAFEIAIRGYLDAQQVLSYDNEEEQFKTIGQLTGSLFDQAVLKDPKYSGKKRRNIFSESIRNKVLSTSGRNSDVPSFKDIRDAEAHFGGVVNLHAKDYSIAIAGCDAYCEAIRYIQSQGWKRNESPLLGSDIATWSNPGLQEKIPTVTQEKSKQVLVAGFKHLVQYVQPDALEKIRTNSPPYSFVHDVLKNI